MSDIEKLLQLSAQQHQLGNLSVAAQGYAAILQADPDCADAWHLAGLVAHQTKRPTDGLANIRRAVELNPQVAEYHSNLAAILISLGRPQLALEAASQARRLDPKFASAEFQYGVALKELGQVDKAIQSLEKSRELGFAPAAVLVELGIAWQYLGDVRGSIEALEASLQLDPLRPPAYFHLSRLVGTGHYRYMESQLTTIRQLIADRNLEPKLRARLHFALATHLEQTEQFVAAFEHYARGNDCLRLQHLGQADDHHQLPAVTDSVIKFFDGDLFERLRGSGSDSRRPIFVVGMPRSGTSLVEKILDSHPHIVGAGELTLLSDLVADRFEHETPVQIQSALSKIDGEWIRRAGQHYLRQLDDRGSAAEHVVDKMPENFLHLGFCRLLFPQATIIHCRRDPRDTCFSAFSQLFQSAKLQQLTGRLESVAAWYHQYDRLMQHWQLVLPGGLHHVYYEQLVQSPEPAVRELLDSCGVEWSEDCLDFHQHRSTVTTASAMQVRAPLYTSSRGRWRRFSRDLQPLFAALGNTTEDYQTALGERGGTTESQMGQQ